MSKRVLALADGSFQLQTIDDKTGAVKGADVFTAEKALDADKAANELRANVARHGAIRRAMLSFLGGVIEQSPMKGYAGKGDRVKGQPSKEAKASMRSALEMTVKKHSKAFKVADTDGTPNEERVQGFIDELRNDKNYANVQTVVLKYWVFCGRSPVTDKGFIVPVPVMLQEIADTLEIPSRDTSLAGELVRIANLLDKRNEKTQLVSEDYGFPSAIAALKSMLATFEGLEREAAERATIAGNTGIKSADPVTATRAAVAAAAAAPAVRVVTEPAPF